MPLIVYSNSTERFAKNITGEFLKVERGLTKEIFKVKTDKNIIAIGGGSVIDAAKIIARNSGNKEVSVIPTTASGAAETSHAVYWQNHRKYSIKTPKPRMLRIDLALLKSLPKEVIRATSYDALGHALESYWSKRATPVVKEFARKIAEVITRQIRNDYPNLEKLIEAGNMAGRAIEITGTNIIHAISYPITGFYGIPHGLAVGLVLPVVARYMECELEIPKCMTKLRRNFDVDLIANEAMKYNRIHGAVKDISKEQVTKILGESL